MDEVIQLKRPYHGVLFVFSECIPHRLLHRLSFGHVSFDPGPTTRRHLACPCKTVQPRSRVASFFLFVVISVLKIVSSTTCSDFDVKRRKERCVGTLPTPPRVAPPRTSRCTGLGSWKVAAAKCLLALVYVLICRSLCHRIHRGNVDDVVNFFDALRVFLHIRGAIMYIIRCK